MSGDGTGPVYDGDAAGDVTALATTPKIEPWRIEVALSKLEERHRAMLLAESAISESVVAERGYKTIRMNNRLREFRDKGWPNVAGAIRRGDVLEIPTFRITGEVSSQFRPDVPRADEKHKKPRVVKYENPLGAAMFPDVHPRIREQVHDVTVPLWFTEGIRKADSAISRGLCCVALTGVDLYRDPGAPVPRLHEDFDSFALRGRRVFIAYDSDVMIKDGVRRALAEFSTLLQQRGAEVKLVYLPSQSNSAKVGLDDYFAAGGTVEELAAHARDGKSGGWSTEIVRMSTVEKQNVDWLWERRIPFGQVTLICGEGGMGKSFLSLGIAAAVSKGNYLPGDSRREAAERPEPGDVLVLNYEDGLGNGLETIMSHRVDQTGCDAERIFAIKGVISPDGKHRPFCLDDLPDIERELDSNPNIKLLIIDPVMSFIGHADTNRDNEVRAALLPLYDMIARRNVACVLVAHVRKADADNALQRVSGSAAFTNSVRSVGLVFREKRNDPETEEMVDGDRMLSFEKHNLTGESDAIPYFIAEGGVFEWGEPRTARADDHMTSRGRARQETRSDPKVSQIREWLCQLLPRGDFNARVPSDDVDRMLKSRGVASGLDATSFKNAKKQEGLESKRFGGFGTPWFFYRPEGSSAREAPQRGRTEAEF